MSIRYRNTAGPSSQEIPTGEPIVPPNNGSVKLLVARLVYVDEPTGAPEELAEEGESDDDLVDRLRASPPPCEYHHGDDLDNFKKFQANICEFS